MTLHDRIMKEVDAFPFNTMSTHVSQSHLDTYVEGFERAKQQSAQLAKEADELMAEMSSMIDSLVGMYALKHCDDAMKSDECHEACELLDRYNTYMERNND